MLFLLPADILISIMNFLSTNTERLSFISVCKYIYNELKNFGFATSIVYKQFEDPFNFFINCIKQYRTIHTITINGLKDFDTWLEYYPECLYLYQCITPKYSIIPPYISVTRIFKFKDLNRSEHKRILKIQWSKFPNLEELHIYAYDCDLSEIKLCSKLKTINMDLCVIKEITQDFIA